MSEFLIRRTSQGHPNVPHEGRPFMDVPWTCYGRATDVPWTCHGRAFNQIKINLNVISTIHTTFDHILLNGLPPAAMTFFLF